MADEFTMEIKDKNIPEEQKELLYNRMEELKYTIAALSAENDMFERFIGRLDQQDLESQAGGEGVWQAVGPQLETGGVGWKQKSRSNVTDRLQLLTLEQKLYVAQKEVAEAQQDQEKLKKEYETIQASYKASIKEAELRLAEIRKARNEFERRFLRFMDKKADMKTPEKMLQYIEDRVKVTQLHKFSLKNQTLRAQEKKLLQQLKQKKEMGRAEYEVFFQEYSEPTDDRNLDELHMNSIKVQQLLGSHKEKLQSVALELTDLNSDITKRNQMLHKLEEEIQHAENGRLKAETLNQHLRKQLTDYQAPDVIDYFHAKAKHKRLQQNIHTWERKVGIAEMALKTHTRERSKHRSTLTPAGSGMSGTRSGEQKVSVKLPHIAEHKY